MIALLRTIARSTARTAAPDSADGAETGREAGLGVGARQRGVALVEVGVHCCNIRQTVGPLHSPGASDQGQCVSGRSAQLDARVDVVTVQLLPTRSDISISQPQLRVLPSHVAPVQLADEGPIGQGTARGNRINGVGPLAESTGDALAVALGPSQGGTGLVQSGAHLGHDREPVVQRHAGRAVEVNLVDRIHHCLCVTFLKCYSRVGTTKYPGENQRWRRRR